MIKVIFYQYKVLFLSSTAVSKNHNGRFYTFTLFMDSLSLSYYPLHINKGFKGSRKKQLLTPPPPRA